MAGKAHSGDIASKQLLQKIIKYMSNELSDHALFIPNYNIEIAQYLTRGCDLWLNTPEMGKEASGTSGMKAISNGVLNLTIQDGWTKEVDWNQTGWILDNNNLPVDLYEQLQKNIIPLFYQRDEDVIPQEWVKMMQNSIKLVDQFSTTRMLKQYLERLYSNGNS